MSNVLTPITYDEACTEVTRFLMHYPRRYIEQDAVVVQDLADEFEIEKFGIGSVSMALRSIRNEYTKDNPWIPQTGYILKEIRERQKNLEDHYRRLAGSDVPLIEHQNDTEEEPKRLWENFTENEKEEAIEFANTLDRNIAKVYARGISMPESMLKQNQEESPE